VSFPAPMLQLPQPGQLVYWRDLRYAYAIGWVDAYVVPVLLSPSALWTKVTRTFLRPSFSGHDSARKKSIKFGSP
jgi:hypothetical protein